MGQRREGALVRGHIGGALCRRLYTDYNSHHLYGGRCESTGVNPQALFSRRAQ